MEKLWIVILGLVVGCQSAVQVDWQAYERVLLLDAADREEAITEEYRQEMWEGVTEANNFAAYAAYAEKNEELLEAYRAIDWRAESPPEDVDSLLQGWMQQVDSAWEYDLDGFLQHMDSGITYWSAGLAAYAAAYITKEAFECRLPYTGPQRCGFFPPLTTFQGHDFPGFFTPSLPNVYIEEDNPQPYASNHAWAFALKARRWDAEEHQYIMLSDWEVEAVPIGNGWQFITPQPLPVGEYILYSCPSGKGPKWPGINDTIWFEIIKEAPHETEDF